MSSALGEVLLVFHWSTDPGPPLDPKSARKSDTAPTPSPPPRTTPESAPDRRRIDAASPHGHRDARSTSVDSLRIRAKFGRHRARPNSDPSPSHSARNLPIAGERVGIAPNWGTLARIQLVSKPLPKLLWIRPNMIRFPPDLAHVGKTACLPRICTALGLERLLTNQGWPTSTVLTSSHRRVAVAEYARVLFLAVCQTKKTASGTRRGGR